MSAALPIYFDAINSCTITFMEVPEFQLRVIVELTNNFSSRKLKTAQRKFKKAHAMETTARNKNNLPM
jgi:hypothetical protein